MNILHRDPPARVERYKTSDGKEFVITRRPHRGRKYQEPQATGDKVSCPYCSQEHEVVYYVVTKGKKTKKKVRAWMCPKVGKLPLNQGRQWDDYVESIIVRNSPEVEASAHREAQTFEGCASPEYSSSLTDELPGGTNDGIAQINPSASEELRSELEVAPSQQTTRSLAKFPVSALASPTGTGKVRLNLAESYIRAVTGSTDNSPRSLKSILDGYVSGTKEIRLTRSRRSSKNTVSPKKHLAFRAK
jgi:hypothetical protein